MSSSFSTEALAPQVERSLRQIKAGNPRAYQELLDVVGELAVRLEVGNEEIAIRFAAGRGIVIEDTLPVVDARVGTDRSTIASVVAGEVTLAEAVLEDRLSIRGSVEVVARLYDGLVAYVMAVVGTPRHETRFVA